MKLEGVISNKLKSSKEFQLPDLLYHHHRIRISGANYLFNNWVINELFFFSFFL